MISKVITPIKPGHRDTIISAVCPRQVKSSQVYLYSACHNIASKQLYSIDQNIITMEKQPRLVELIKSITDWLIN